MILKITCYPKKILKDNDIKMIDEIIINNSIL